MKKISVTIYTCALLVASAAALTACGDGNSLSGTPRAGVLNVTLTTDSRVTTTDGGTLDTHYVTDPASISLTLSNSDGEYFHTWPDATEFPQGEYFLAGAYSLSAACGSNITEGFDLPSFSGNTVVNIQDETVSDVTLPLTLDNSFLSLDCSPQLAQSVEDFSILVNTPGGIFFEVTPAEKRLLCLTPSAADVYANLTLTDGRTAKLKLLSLPSTAAATLYQVHVSAEATSEGLRLDAACGSESNSLLLTDRLLDTPAPSVTTSWTSEARIMLDEGETCDMPLVATVESAGPLRSVMLSANSLPLRQLGFPAEVDLLHLTPAERDALSSMGVKISGDASSLALDLTNLTSYIYYIDNLTALSQFTIVAVGEDSQVSAPATLIVESRPVELTVEKANPIVMGEDRGSIDVRCQASAFASHVKIFIPVTDALGVPTESWTEVSPLTVTELSAGFYSVSFPVPAGSLPLDVRLSYCHEERARVTLPRKMPDFSIEVDPYATVAAIRVVAAEQSMLEAITRAVHIYIDGAEAPAYTTEPSRGLISVIGLLPDHSYTFTATMMSGVNDLQFTPGVTVTTEREEQLPNSDFEERRDGPAYSNMHSGGRFSQTMVEIYNQQHYASFSTEVPKQWATVNAKTFCMGSSNFNTWYMQPSTFLTRSPVFSQSFAVELVSTAFDPRGPEIPPYQQTSQPYLNYSPIVPDIACRAAGKLFLGSYSYNPATLTETYTEGIDWRSRPMSLNGYYRFYPSDGDRNDCGLARVEILGKVDGHDVVIASGESRLALALSYTAFSVPLTYTRFGVKATRIKVMFASSAAVGDIAYETANVVTVPDPVTATSLGSRLWIDNVTLAY